MKLFKAGLILIVVMLVGVFAAADDDEKGKDAAATITMAELKDHMYFLASDFLGGRVVGTPGYEIATQYAISQFRAAGIQPILKDEEGNDTYLQKVPLMQLHYSDDATWQFRNPAGSKTSMPGSEMVTWSVAGSRIVEKEKELYFVGYGISEPDYGWDDLKGLDLTNKVAVVLIDTPEKNGKPVLPEELNESYLGLKGLNKRIWTYYDRGITSFIFLSTNELSSMWEKLNDKVTQKDIVSLEEFAEKPEKLIAYANDGLSKFIMGGQEYSPYNNPKNPREGYKTFPMKNAGIQLLATKEEKEIETWNVVGVIPGSDEKLKDEYIVLGGHLDHIPPVKGEICNGADDNASGSIGVIETGEALASRNNKRSILVCLWAAEEVGLLGSEYFLENSPVEVEKMKVNINLDMIARTDKENLESRQIYATGSNNAAPEFTQFIKKVNSNSVNWPIIFEDEGVGGGGSDHAGFSSRGIPVVFFFSGFHEDYHRPTDDPEKLDWEKFLNVSRLACSLVDSLANTDQDIGAFRKPEEKEVVH